MGIFTIFAARDDSGSSYTESHDSEFGSFYTYVSAQVTQVDSWDEAMRIARDQALRGITVTDSDRPGEEWHAATGWLTA